MDGTALRWTASMYAPSGALHTVVADADLQAAMGFWIDWARRTW